jgi:hypothetical protein
VVPAAYRRILAGVAGEGTEEQDLEALSARLRLAEESDTGSSPAARLERQVGEAFALLRGPV